MSNECINIFNIQIEYTGKTSSNSEYAEAMVTVVCLIHTTAITPP